MSTYAGIGAAEQQISVSVKIGIVDYIDYIDRGQREAFVGGVRGEDSY
jgi:hypothetical protein